LHTDSIAELNGHNFPYSSLLYGGWFAAAAAAAVANKTPPSHLFGLQGKYMYKTTKAEMFF